MVTAPRWFFPLVAVCLVVLTVAASYRLLLSGRFASTQGFWVVDTHTGEVCNATSCVPFRRPNP